MDILSAEKEDDLHVYAKSSSSSYIYPAPKISNTVVHLWKWGTAYREKW